MLGITHLNGFGSIGNDPGTLSATFLLEASSTTAILSLIPASFTPAAGSRLLVLTAMDNSETSGGSPYAGTYYLSGPALNFTEITSVTQDPGAANAGVTVAAALSDAVAGSLMELVVNFDYSTTSSTVQVWQITPKNASGISVSTQSSTGNGTAPSTTISALDRDLVFGVLGIEARTAATGDAAWSTVKTTLADTGTAGTSISLAAQHINANGDGTHTHAPTFGATARDYAALVIRLRPT